MPEETPATTRVLIAEDDAVTTALIRYRLDREPGLEVQHYADGLDALSALQRDHFDLAVLDVNMPGLDGFGVLNQIRADPRLAAVPVLMLTSQASEADIVGALEMGADDFMAKPFSPAELIARIHRLLSARRQRGGP